MGADESSLQELDDSPEASARRAVASGSVDAASLVASEHARVHKPKLTIDVGSG